jgi:putative membrane protein
MLKLERGHVAPLAVLLLVLIPFSAYFGYRRNYEFLLYVVVILFFMAVIALTNDRVRYPLPIIWGLVAWAILHMCGGGVKVGDGVLYGVMLLPLSDTVPILRYDQFVHIVGFGVATLVMYHLLRPLLRPDLRGWTSLSIVVVMAGLGVGALNEIIEFIATLLMPETGVGGYENTALDLVSDLVGAVLALVLVRLGCLRPASRV